MDIARTVVLHSVMETILPTSRHRILWSGLSLLSETGLSGVSLGLLAERVGISKSGLFAHFRSKEQLQIALLDQTVEVAAVHVILPAMQQPEGLPRLQAFVRRWLGWSARAGLRGGCPIAAALFELDDVEGPVRDRAVAMEGHWRGLLRQLVQQAVEQGHLRPDLDVEQFIWELCGIYLSHHASLRFLRDPNADARAYAAFDTLLRRSEGDGRETASCP